MDHDGLLASERIEEVTMICGREQSIYEKISSFGIALYVLGFFNCDDIMSIEDIDQVEAGIILEEYFTEINKKDLPSDYYITTSKEKYLLVIGDPQFPVHFAVVVDTESQRPFFSKLRYFGSGFDSLEELMKDFVGEDGLTLEDIHYFQKKQTVPEKISRVFSRIYIVKDDGDYSLCKHNKQTQL